jgi:hypothetical protein
VSGGILVLNPRGMEKGAGFRVPYADSRWFLIPVWIIVLFVLYFSNIQWNIETMISRETLFHKLPFMVFILISIWISVMAVVRRWSLIPVLGLLTNLYLMSELGITNWMRFLIWLAIGLILYFLYGSKHSLLRNKDSV